MAKNTKVSGDFTNVHVRNFGQGSELVLELDFKCWYHRSLWQPHRRWCIDILLNSRILNLKSNHLKGQLPHLSANVKELNIANNSFSGSISTFLCHEVNRRNKLEFLDASNNLLSGELSDCWRYWQSLIHLNLGRNNLSGRILYSMESLVVLKALRLNNNSISGDIPSSLQKCSNLTLIDIGENHFPMTIPLWIGKMPSLQILRLRLSGFKAIYLYKYANFRLLEYWILLIIAY